MCRFEKVVCRDLWFPPPDTKPKAPGGSSRESALRCRIADRTEKRWHRLRSYRRGVRSSKKSDSRTVSGRMRSRLDYGRDCESLYKSWLPQHNQSNGLISGAFSASP